MKIEQFKDAPLAHYSYAIISDRKMALVDPGRDPMPYYKFAEEQHAKIVAVFETHPHADFVSSHLQIHQQTGAVIYTSKLLGAEYEYESFDDGDSFKMGEITFKALNTPGHSPDGISIIAEAKGRTALFTGDTLFIGDVGRPDLRENAGNMTAKRVELAKEMYYTIQEKFTPLPNEALIYPAHGAGSLCGKNMSSNPFSTLGNERSGNWAFQKQSEKEFVENLLKDQPFIPAYFGFNVDINKSGAENVQQTKANVKLKLLVKEVKDELPIVDTREEGLFKKGHLTNSINIMARSENDKFETWMGAIIEPEEPFYLVAESIKEVEKLLERTAKIGYEKQLKGIFTLSKEVSNTSDTLDVEDFRKNQKNYTIIDIRNTGEVADGKIFDNAIPIPLNELRDQSNGIDLKKPIVVHCAGGYRSASGSSILKNKYKNVKVYDLGEAIRDFK